MTTRIVILLSAGVALYAGTMHAEINQLRTVHGGDPYFEQSLCCVPLFISLQDLIVTQSAQFNNVQVSGDLCVSGEFCSCITGTFCVNGPGIFGSSLSVTGTATVGAINTGLLQVNTAVIDNLTVTTSLGGLLSDERLKHNVQRLTPGEALKALLKVRPVRFEWINPELHGGCACAAVGFLAQEMEKLIPEMVVGCPVHEKELPLLQGDEKAKGLRLSHELAAYMVASIHALHNQIKKLQKEVDALKQ